MVTIDSLNQTLAHCWVASRDLSSSSSSRSLEFNKHRVSSLVRQERWNISWKRSPRWALALIYPHGVDFDDMIDQNAVGASTAEIAQVTALSKQF